MRRIYHPYTTWEDFKAGMWRKCDKADEERILPSAVAFTGDHLRYGSFMLQVALGWPFACEHNLTDVAMNRRAWIGHAACCLAIGAPEYLTRRAWWMLTQEQRDAADAQADSAIREWTWRHKQTRKQRVFNFEGA